jgi:post-segregation antitoxin (ccd killing protein)
VKPVTETVKIDAPKESVERLRRHGADIDKLVAETLEKEADRLDESSAEQAADRISVILRDVPDEIIVAAIRKSRDEH